MKYQTNEGKKMTKKIALFNHKGGVSKTTTTFNLGWMLASKGKNVVLVDADPQCNLTGLVLGYKGLTEFEQFYETETERNLRAGLAPAFESRPKPIEAVECIPVDGQESLFMLPGHIRLAEYEVTLGIAQELSGTIQTLQNLPGSISFLLDKTAEKFHADYVLIDMNPSLSSINQNLLMTSDFFIVPTSPDYFSVMAIDSLATVLPRWHAWADKAHSLPILKDASYPFPQITPKFLGIIVQKYRPRGKSPATGFQNWIDKIEDTVSSKLVPVLSKNGMMLPDHVYNDQGVGPGFCLATIPDFNTLIAKSQEAQTPVFALTPEQIGYTGPVLENTIKSRDNFKQIFSELAGKIIGLTSNASGD
jgi:cellulose biosynthesis protein BcsQ